MDCVVDIMVISDRFSDNWENGLVVNQRACR